MNDSAAIAAAERVRDAGLVRAVGPLALTGAFVGILVGSAIFTIPSIMAASVDSYAPLAYLACALAVGCVMLCFAEASSRVPTAGGPQGFVAAAFGPYAGFLTGAFNWGSEVLAAGGIAAAAADAIGTVVPSMAAGPVRAIAIIGWLFGLAFINITGVGIAARFVAIATSVKLIPLAILIAVGAWFVAPANLVLPLAAGHTDIGRAAIAGVFMFMGIEASLAVSGEVRDPARTIPRAVIASLVGYTLMCIAVQLVVQGILGDALGVSKAPLGDAMIVVSRPLGLLLIAGAAISMLGWTASDALAAPRMLFGMARDGTLPAALGFVHPRTHAPWVACLVHAAVAAGLAVTGSFTGLVIVSSLVAVLLYIIGCAAAVKLRRDGIALAGTPVRIPALGLVAALGAIAMVWVGVQSTREEAVGITIFIAVASLLYAFRRLPVPATA